MNKPLVEFGAMKIFGIAGYSGSGKTTLIEKLIPIIAGQGLTVSLIKHAHHSFDVDQPGKDSYRHRHAGCTEVLVASSARWVLMHELRGAAEPPLEDIVAKISPCDVLLIEGYKRAPIPKLEVRRSTISEPLLFPADPHVVAIAADYPVDCPLPYFDLNDAPRIAGFVVGHLGL
jgi:molybdopterin-guanine dinucleotide biosynthesis protein B